MRSEGRQSPTILSGWQQYPVFSGPGEEGNLAGDRHDYTVLSISDQADTIRRRHGACGSDLSGGYFCWAV